MNIYPWLDSEIVTEESIVTLQVFSMYRIILANRKTYVKFLSLILQDRKFSLQPAVSSGFISYQALH